jgi:large subunit ribosomal protein L20
MRVKRGNVRKKRHKKVLKETKGYRMTKSKLYKVAHEAYLHAGQYSHHHRKRKHSQMRRIWIDRINSAARQNDTKYSVLMHDLKKAKSKLNRKVLADIAFNNPEVFSNLVKSL